MARSPAMGFTIGYDVGPLGYILVALGVGAAAIVLIWLVQASREARRDVKERERDAENPAGDA